MVQGLVEERFGEERHKHRGNNCRIQESAYADNSSVKVFPSTYFQMEKLHEVSYHEA